MVALQIRDVPDDVRDTLARLAGEQGRSLQSYLLELVLEETRRAHNRSVLARFAHRSDGSRMTSDEVEAEIDATRPP